MNATLSAALIVKNEEMLLSKCLDSIKDLVDEIVIVDTGSTDKTKEIAAKYTDKVFDFNWIDDFSAARNFSFSKCTKDFILWIDSDDIVRPADVEKIKNLDYSDKEIILCKYQYSHDEFGNVILSLTRERIIKRSLNLKWEQPIHEYLPLNAKTFTSDIEIHHYKKGGTSERNIKILESIVKKNPKDSRNQYYLGKEYFDFGKQKEARIYLEKFVHNKFGWWEDKYLAYFMLAQIHYSQPNEFKKYIFKCIDLEERRSEAYYLMGQFFMDRQNWIKAIHWFNICLNTPIPKDLSASLLLDYYTWLPALQAVVCYNSIGNIEKAKECNDIVLKYRPNDSRALNNKTILEKALKKAVPKQDGQGKKLNLGCGAKTIQGYENVDVYKASYIDAVYDLCEIPYNDSTISEIHSEHALEHVGYELGKKAIKEWFRVLKPGGILDLKIPDIEACASAYLRTTNNEMVNGFPAKLWYLYTIYGIQKSQAGEADEFQCHRWGYSKESISALLTEVGFRNISVIHYDGWGTLSLHVTARKFRETIKIGWIAPINWEAVQTRVRVLNINQWLYSKGYESNVVNYPEIISQNYDVAVVGKCFDIHHYQNIKLLKQHRKTVFCDLCEDILEFPYVKEIIKICDKIICCSHVLEEKVKKINLNTVVIEDAYEK